MDTRRFFVKKSQPEQEDMESETSSPPAAKEEQWQLACTDSAVPPWIQPLYGHLDTG